MGKNIKKEPCSPPCRGGSVSCCQLDSAAGGSLRTEIVLDLRQLRVDRVQPHQAERDGLGGVDGRLAHGLLGVEASLDGLVDLQLRLGLNGPVLDATGHGREDFQPGADEGPEQLRGHDLNQVTVVDQQGHGELLGHQRGGASPVFVEHRQLADEAAALSDGLDAGHRGDSDPAERQQKAVLGVLLSGRADHFALAVEDGAGATGQDGELPLRDVVRQQLAALHQSQTRGLVEVEIVVGELGGRPGVGHGVLQLGLNGQRNIVTSGGGRTLSEVSDFFNP